MVIIPSPARDRVTHTLQQLWKILLKIPRLIISTHLPLFLINLLVEVPQESSLDWKPPQHNSSLMRAARCKRESMRVRPGLLNMGFGLWLCLKREIEECRLWDGAAWVAGILCAEVNQGCTAEGVMWVHVFSFFPITNHTLKIPTFFRALYQQKNIHSLLH